MNNWALFWTYLYAEIRKFISELSSNIHLIQYLPLHIVFHTVYSVFTLYSACIYYFNAICGTRASLQSLSLLLTALYYHCAFLILHFPTIKQFSGTAVHTTVHVCGAFGLSKLSSFFMHFMLQCYFFHLVLLHFLQALWLFHTAVLLHFMLQF